MIRPADERGSVAPFIAVVSLALVMVAGMAYDGGQIVAAQARARDLAGNAARAGAQEIDLTVLRATGRPELLPDQAAAAARSYLAEVDVTGDVVVVDDRITVTVRLRQPMRILPLPDRTVEASDTATAVAALTGKGDAA
ncbi:MAG: pilus assembly protein TadG-related protein [Acidimicrobiia bacterium]